MARVLVVDDDAANRNLVVALLGYGGHTVVEAADGGEALVIARTERPELLITDLLMPVLDGLELVREIRSDPATATIPVIFYTANYRRDEVDGVAATLGVGQLLAKPIDPTEFIQVVEASLAAGVATAPIAAEAFQREHGRTVNAKLLDTVEELTLTENALRDSEARFRLLAEFSPIGIFALTATGTVSYANPKMREICGLSDGMPAPPQWRDLVHPEDRARVVEELSAAIGQRSKYAGGLRLLRSDRQQRWIQMQLTPASDASAQASFVGTVEDVTEVVAANRERAQIQRRLQAADRLESLGQLAAGIAHDFNNLLAIIINYTQFVRTGITALAASAASPAPAPAVERAQLLEDIGAISGAAERGARLTRQLLMFARRDVAHPEVLDVNDVIRGAVALLDRTIGEHVQFVQGLAAEPWPVLIDRGQFEQVLVNLVVNARDAVGAGGMVEVATANVDLDTSAAAQYGYPGPVRCVRVTVSDDGAGMTAETKARAFEPFFSTKPTGSGTGLGLSTAYGIVTQFGGAIAIESEPQRGTRVTVMLPAHHAHSVADDSHPVPSTDRATAGGFGRILVAEDDAAIGAIIRRVLSEHGYSVVLVTGGSAALHVLEDPAARIDLLLTDVVMPGMSGRELAERATASRPDLPVLFMSGYADGLFAQPMVDSDVELLEKPFSPQVLLTAIGRACARGADRADDSVRR